ncbi:hypothetical protein [Collinsella sp. TM10-22]|uniref:hypothetical protein n=1 Tax=Collinsella sp. TM10-22 TaxID=2292344 RepID=UPI001F18BDB3|nr:hypothetical protein [Collinsella sp. TM10-22]
MGCERHRAERRATGARQCGAATVGLGELEPLDITDAPAGTGPARYWRFPGAAGTVGFISAMSNHFARAATACA